MNRIEQELFLKVLKTTLENSPYSHKNHVKPTQLQLTGLQPIVLLRIGSHGYLPKSFQSSGEIVVKGITLVKRSVYVYTMSICLYLCTQTCIHPHTYKT